MVWVVSVDGGQKIIEEFKRSGQVLYSPVLGLECFGHPSDMIVYHGVHLPTVKRITGGFGLGCHVTAPTGGGVILDGITGPRH